LIIISDIYKNKAIINTLAYISGSKPTNKPFKNEQEHYSNHLRDLNYLLRWQKSEQK